MNDRVRVELEPLGRRVDVERGAWLRDVLYAHGVEFPCGGRGRCGRCRVRLLSGSLEASEEERGILGAEAWRRGWRLACRARVQAAVRLQVEQFQAPILTDHTPFEFAPRPGLGVAVDVGTTTLVAQLLDLESGAVLAVESALNPQAAYGSDVLHRLEHAATGDGRRRLTGLVRDAVGALLGRAVAAAGASGRALSEVVLVGNTAMHHLFGGLDVAPLIAAPFAPTQDGLRETRAAALGWRLEGDPTLRFLPCLGGFVGSDVLAGILATRLHESREPTVLLDLGTNGEVVVGNAERMLCASTAAGPAFEAGGIEHGMQATTGAIHQVGVADGGLGCRVLGGGAARGICGSGLLDAVACGLELGWIEPSGRLASGRRSLALEGPVHISQADVRQLQLAKAAVAAALALLLERWGAAPGDVARVHLAGAFGHSLTRDSARRVGLFAFPSERVEAAGNTALLGAKLALFRPPGEPASFDALRARVEHVPLVQVAGFQEAFVAATRFPG